MSRIGKQPIAIPDGVTVDYANCEMKVKGPKGSLATPLPESIGVEVGDGVGGEDDVEAAVGGVDGGGEHALVGGDPGEAARAARLGVIGETCASICRRWPIWPGVSMATLQRRPSPVAMLF